MEEKIKVKPEMTIAEVLKIKPLAAEILMAHGMHCLGCIIAQGETVSQAAEVHGLEVNQLVEEINRIP